MATNYNVHFTNQNAGLQVGHLEGDVYYGSTKQPNLKRDILQWISNIPYRKHHATVLEGILPGSGEWLLQKESYQEWLTSDESSTLWLRGIPGCGKTRLVAHTIQALYRQQGLAYFYCTRDPADIKRADPDEILRSLLRQLLAFDELPQDVIDLYHKSKNDAEEFKEQLALPTIEQCTAFILKIVGQPPLTLIIDALDECDPNKRYCLMNALAELVSKASTNIKIFISSRDDSDIVMRMKATPNIMISASDNSVDIKRYVDTEIDRAIQNKRLLLGSISLELSNSIKSGLTEKAQGMFQWVNLVIQSICERYRVQLAEDIPNEIARLPSGLKELYGLSLRRIYDKAERSQEAAICILRWLLGAQASLICPEFTGVISAITGVRLEVQDVVDLCDNLITIDPELNVFRFAHLSVREFLESNTRFSRSSIHSSIGLQCLQIYFAGDKTVQPFPMDNTFCISYEQYACFYWPFHFYLSGWQTEHALLDAILEPDEEKLLEFDHWTTIVAQFTERSLPDVLQHRMELSFGSHMHPIFIAIAFELQHYVHRMANKLDQALTNRFDQSPLALACTLGNSSACEVLITSKTNLNALDISRHHGFTYTEISTNPLAASVLGQHWGIMKMLISAGADLNLDISDGVSGSALHIAIRLGLLWLVRDLVAAGANVNLRSVVGTPLQCAAYHGHVDIYRFLLAQGAEDKIKCGYRSDDGPLELAAGSGHLEAVKFLLDTGISIDDNSSVNGTALTRAAKNRHIHVVEYLLQKGAQLDISSGRHGTPFLSAVAGGSIEIVKMFLDHGADIDQKGTGIGNALVIAVVDKNDALVSFLLQRGADIEGELLYDGVIISTKLMVATESSLEAMKALVQCLKPANRETDLQLLLRQAFLHRSISKALEKIEWLLELGAQLDVSDADGTTVVHLAASRQARSLLLLALDNGASVATISKIYGSSLQALYHWDPRRYGVDSDCSPDEAFDILTASGIDVNSPGGIFGNALQAASYRGTVKHCEALLKLGAVEPEQDGYFGHSIIAAAAMGHNDVVRLLLEHNFNVNARSETHGYALQLVACLGRQPASTLLNSINHGYSLAVDQRPAGYNPMGYNPMGSLRDVSSFRDIFQFLIESGADINLIGGYFGTVLQAASYAGQISFVKQLLERGAALESGIGIYGCSLQAACCNEIKPPWFLSAGSGLQSEEPLLLKATQDQAEHNLASHLEVINLLIAHGADVNEKGGFFDTALQAACHSCDADIVRRLLDAGAVVCEDGDGFYGGCIYASISFGIAKIDDLIYVEDIWDDNVAILKMILDNVKEEDIIGACQAAIERAKKDDNQVGSKLFREVLSTDKAHDGLFSELFPEGNMDGSS